MADRFAILVDHVADGDVASVYCSAEHCYASATSERTDAANVRPRVLADEFRALGWAVGTKNLCPAHNWKAKA